MEDDQPWLDDAEQATWIRLAQLVVRLPATLDAQLQRDSGLSWFEYMVLAMVSEQPTRRLRLSALARLANGSLSRLSHVVTRLERQGLVVRRPDPDDGRYTDAVLTDAGWDRVVAAAPGHVRAVRSVVFDGLSAAQVRQLHVLTGRMVSRLDDGTDCGS